MDSLVEKDLNKDLQFSSSSSSSPSKVFSTKSITRNKTLEPTNSIATYAHSFSSTNANRNFSFNTNHQSSTVLLRRISKKLKLCMLKTPHFLFYIFLILTLVHGFNLSTVLAIKEGKSRPEFVNISTASSSSQLLAALTSSQLPVEALIFEANTPPDAIKSTKNNTNITKHGSHSNYTNVIHHKLDGNNSSNSTGTSSSSSSNNNTNNKIYNTDASVPWSIFSNTNAIKAISSTASSLSHSPLPLPSSSSSYFLRNGNDNLSSMPSHLPTATTFYPDTQSSASSTTTADGFRMPEVHAVLVSIILLLVIVGTIVGNILVCIAVCMVRKLRRPCNYLLVSLALSDLCVAVLVMPIALMYEVFEKWDYGIVLCDVWVSFDVLCCTASILNLCAISVDRYLAITKPLEYGVKRTPRRMALCVALVWLAAACISLPPLLILGNEHEDEHGNPMCSVCQNFAYQIYATLGSFYIPLAVMLFVYYQIFKAARRIVLEEKRAQTHLQHALNGTGSTPPGHTELDDNRQHRHSSYGNTSLNYSTCGGLSASQAGGTGGGGSGSSGLLGSPHQKKLRFQLAKEKKASTTLGIIMSAFTICWLPFFILALIRPFVESETTHVPQSLSSLFLWLGYANSLLNPIIYATLNRDFRKPFQEILYFRCSSLNTMMRENYYQDQYGEPPSQRVVLAEERHGARESFL